MLQKQQIIGIEMRFLQRIENITKRDNKKKLLDQLTKNIDQLRWFGHMCKM